MCSDRDALVSQKMKVAMCSDRDALGLDTHLSDAENSYVHQWLSLYSSMPQGPLVAVISDQL